MPLRADLLLAAMRDAGFGDMMAEPGFLDYLQSMAEAPAGAAAAPFAAALKAEAPDALAGVSAFGAASDAPLAALLPQVVATSSEAQNAHRFEG